MATSNQIADALRAAFISPTVDDSNGEPANVVDVMDGQIGALREIACAIGDLANVIALRFPLYRGED